MLPEPPKPFEIILKSSIANALLSTIFGIWSSSLLAGIACFVAVCLLLYASVWVFNRWMARQW